MMSATARAPGSGMLDAAFSRCSRAATVRAGSPSLTPLKPTAKSSSMLTKSVCPRIEAQSPDSTTARARIDASSFRSASGVESPVDVAVRVLLHSPARERAGGGARAGACQGARHGIHHAARIREPALLQVLVVQPRQAVKVLFRRRAPGAFHPGHRCRKRRLVRPHGIVPHAERKEHVRRHVQRVARRRRERRVDPRRPESQPIVHAIVEGMKRVVRGSRVLGVLRQDAGRERSSLQRDLRVPCVLGDGREQGQRVERRGFVVVGVVAGQRRHAVCVRLQPGRTRAVTEQSFDGVEVRLLARRWRPGRAKRPVRSEPTQDRAGARHVFVVPERLAVRERFAPERHGKARRQTLRLAERRDGFVVLEVVEPEHAALERGLRRNGARGGKCDPSEAGVLRGSLREQRRRRQQTGDGSSGQTGRHRLRIPRFVPAKAHRPDQHEPNAKP